MDCDIITTGDNSVDLIGCSTICWHLIVVTTLERGGKSFILFNGPLYVGSPVEGEIILIMASVEGKG